MRLDLLKQMNEERAARRAAVLVTDTASGEQRLVKANAVESDALAAVLEPALRMGKSGTVEHEGHSYFLTVQVPPVRLVCIGAVHITQALAPIARVAGFDMIIVDPRTAFATPERFPDVQVIAEWPDVALPPLGIDRYTAMGFFTHDPKIDDPGLVQALRAECFYIGTLGSRKTHAKRIERMKAEGFADEQLARIRAPVGLDIGAVTPAEIAVSVIAEVIMALRKKPLRAESAAAAGVAA